VLDLDPSSEEEVFFNRTITNKDKMSKRTVHIFYDVVSPYSYFAFEVLCRYKGRWNLDLKLRPFFLGGVMKGSGNKPPASNPEKGKYLFEDVARLSKYFDIPVKFPTNMQELIFQNGSMTAQRFLTAVELECPDKVESVTRALWTRAWGQDEDIIKPAGIITAAVIAGLPKEKAEDMLTRVKSDAVMDRLRLTTQEALDHGAFGAPIIVFELNGEQEMIFGSDRFPVMAHMLGLKWEGPNPGVASRL